MWRASRAACSGLPLARWLAPRPAAFARALGAPQCSVAFLASPPLWAVRLRGTPLPRLRSAAAAVAAGSPSLRCSRGGRSGGSFLARPCLCAGANMSARPSVFFPRAWVAGAPRTPPAPAPRGGCRASAPLRLARTSCAAVVLRPLKCLNGTPAARLRFREAGIGIPRSAKYAKLPRATSCRLDNELLTMFD